MTNMPRTHKQYNNNIDRKPSQERYKIFAASYAANGRNATQAAIEAGYSTKTAYSQGQRLLKNDEVRMLLAEFVKEVMDEKKITVDKVIDVIIETMDRCRQVKPVLNRKGEQVFVETPDGELRAAFEFNPKGVLMATDQLGKYLKMFTDKTEISGPDGGPVKIASDDKEIIARYFAEKKSETKGE